MGQPVEKHHWTRVSYLQVPEDFKDACFEIYNLSIDLLDLQADPPHLNFFQWVADESKADGVSEEKVCGWHDWLTGKVWIDVNLDLPTALLSTAHECLHARQRKDLLADFPQGFPKLLSNKFEAEAFAFEQQAYKLFMKQKTYRYGLSI